MTEESPDILDQTYGLGWRVTISILVGVGWLAFLLLWFFFYTNQYNWEKHVAVVLLSFLVVFVLLGLPWLIWWQQHRSLEEKEMWRTPGFKPRVIASAVSGGVVLVVLIYWFWILAEPYLWYQNLIIFIVGFLIMGGVLGAMWASWGMKHGAKPHKTHTKK
ncbi:MAG: hypothetical protein JXA00_04140 [Candidatus Thermoplasmatota archaeon]|nr:hypothetical protein [Candidatus Thermoplasmatota archaeon]